MRRLTNETERQEFMQRVHNNFNTKWDQLDELVRGKENRERWFQFFEEYAEEPLDTKNSPWNMLSAVWCDDASLFHKKEFDADAADRVVKEMILKSRELPLGEPEELFGAGSEDTKELRKELREALNKAKALEESNNALASSNKALESAVKLYKDKEAKSKYDVEVESDGSIPEGKVVMAKIKDIFPGLKSKMEVPMFQWDGVHPDVPKVDPHYIFREKELLPVLYAIKENRRGYLQGHTGAGKTSLIEQVCARLNWPFVRINFDSEVTRSDLVGRDVLAVEDGNTVSRFMEGILVKAMAGPTIMCLDEIDFTRPDVAYVMQAVLESDSFKIMEDGGRVIEPHPMFRVFATGNTKGQGDEDNIYQGARVQSLALLDRFTVWLEVPYLTLEERHTFITRHFPELSEQRAHTVNKYVEEHLTAFTEAKIMLPLSPRGIKEIVSMALFYTELGVKEPLKDALTSVVLNRANQSDRPVIQGIIDRVCK